MTCYSIGIDNGVSGALAALDSEGGLIGWLPMPTVKARKGSEIDVCAVWTWVQDMTCGETTVPIYTIEEPGGSKSAKAGASMAGSFHAIRAMLAVKRCRMQRVTPQAWQRVMMPGCKAGDTKARAYEVARRMWPDERWLATDRCKKAHDGGIDAALIALYGSSLVNSNRSI